MHIEVLSSQIDVLVEQQIKIATEAEYLNAEYWNWFAEENNTITGLKRSGLTDKSPARVAPIVEKKRSGESNKYYLNWKSFDNSSIRKINKSFSQHLRLSKGKNPMAIIEKHCRWELPKVLEHEARLKPLRITLDGLRDAEIKLRSTLRKIENIK